MFIIRDDWEGVYEAVEDFKEVITYFEDFYSQNKTIDAIKYLTVYEGIKVDIKVKVSIEKA